MTEEYVKQVGRSAYLWAWPMVNMHNRKQILEKLPEPGLMGGIVPVAPVNQLSMLATASTRRTIGGLPESGCGVRIWSFLTGARACGGSSAGFRRAILGLSSCGSTYGFIRANREDVWHEAGILYACRAGLERRDSRRDNRNVSRKDESWSCDTARVPRRHCRRPRGHPTDSFPHSDVSAQQVYGATANERSGRSS